MSAIKTVFDFMNAAPDDYNHELRYKSVLSDLLKSNSSEALNIDLRSFERSTLGIGEMNILGNVLCDLKFRLDKMDEKFSLVSSSLAKQVEKDLGKGTLSNDRTYEESFLAQEMIDFVPNGVMALEPTRSATLITSSKSSYRRIMASLHGLSAATLAGVGITVANDMVSVRQDLRHMFLKGYLILCSYNLAISSCRTEFEHNDITSEVIPGPTPEERLGVMMTKPLVVDVEHFTKEELWLLVEMCDEYPRKRFGVDTIYGNIYLEGEEAVFLARDKTFSHTTEPGYGSPERLWNNLISIALKFNALEDLREVLRDMRGMPYIAHDIARRTGVTSFTLKYPISNSLTLAIAGVHEVRPTIKEFSSYYATTKSLVCDLMLGQMMVMGAYNALEEFGVFGTLGCPTSKPVTDAFFNSTLRNRGLKNNLEHENDLLSEWRGVRSTECVLRFGGKLKTYLNCLADQILGGNTSFLRPQLLHSLPFSNFRETTWATIRGWDTKVFSLDTLADDQIRNSLLTKAYSWVMGVNQNIPLIGINGYGLDAVVGLTSEELKFIQCASGRYEISMVQHRLEGALLPRTDEMETGPKSFYSTRYPGTRCTVVFTTGGRLKMRVDASPMVGKASDTVDPAMSRRAPKEKSYYSFGGSKVPFSSFGTADPRARAKYSEMSGTGVVDEPVQESDYYARGRGRRESNTANPGGRGRGRGRSNNNRQPFGTPADSFYDNSKRRPPARFNEPTAKDGELRKERPGGYRDSRVDDGMGTPTDPMEPDVEIDSTKRITIAPLTNLEYDENMNIVGPDFVTWSGKKLERVFRGPVNNELGESISGYILNTVGDGACGIHAIVQDLMIHGFVPASCQKEAWNNLLDVTLKDTFHSTNELATILNAMGFGVHFILPDTKQVWSYGTKGSLHNLCIHHSGNHYSTFLLDSRGETKLTNMRVMSAETTPDVELQKLARVMHVLDGPLTKNFVDHINKAGGGEGLFDDAEKDGSEAGDLPDPPPAVPF